MHHFLDLAGRVLAVWLVSLGINLVVYFVVTSLIVYSLRLFWDKGLQRRKIQKRQATRADIRREIASSLRTALIFSVIYTAVYFGARANLFTIYLGIQPLGGVYLLASIGAIILAHETYFYWFHRLMHHRLLFVWFHRTHHKSITPTVYACFALDVPEALLIGFFLPLWLLAVPMQLLALSIALTFLLARNALGHCGVELFSDGPGRKPGFGWLSSNTDHDLHHSTFHYNYGFCLNVWDRLMGTEHPSCRTPRQASPQPGAIEEGLPMPSTESSR